jgi:hypothetical protein
VSAVLPRRRLYRDERNGVRVIAWKKRSGGWAPSSTLVPPSHSVLTHNSAGKLHHQQEKSRIIVAAVNDNDDDAVTTRARLSGCGAKLIARSTNHSSIARSDTHVDKIAAVLLLFRVGQFVQAAFRRRVSHGVLVRAGLGRVTF